MNSPLFVKHKYSFVGCCMLLILLVPFLMSEKKPEPARKHFLHMQGQIKNGKENLSRTVIEIFYSDSASRYCMMQSDTGGWCEFQLPLQNHFLIKFMKYGYITKKITVDTYMPEKMMAEYYCEFSTEMFPQIPEIDVSVLKRPVANFFFNKQKRNFDYDALSSAKINREIKAMYAKQRHARKNENIVAKKNHQEIPVPLR